MAWTLARVRGIAVRVHWSLLLVLPFFAYIMAREYFEEATGLEAYAWGAALAVTLFASVLVHEFSHSLMALRRGQTVRSILLFPLGGMSQMETMPERPRDEFLITIVGPLTNFVLAAPLLGLHYSGLGPSGPAGAFVLWSGWLNVALGAFNLFLPAFPMDGGRLLRSGLAARLGARRGTRVAANVGRGVAVLMAVFGVLAWSAGGIWLVLIAFFVFVGAGAEERSTIVRSRLSDLRARDVMTSDVDVVDADATLRETHEQMARTRHLALPVVDQGRVVGVVGVEALAAGEDVRVREVMRDMPTAAPDDQAVELMAPLERGDGHVAVVEGARLVGIVSATDLDRIVQVQEAARRRGARAGRG